MFGLGCGPGIESAADSQGGGTTAVAASGSSSATGAHSTTDDCTPLVEAITVVQISESRLQRLHVVDLDANGHADLVDDSGTIMLGLEDGFDEQVVAGWPDAEAVVVGQFDAQPELDLLAVTKDAIHNFAAAGRGAEAVTTATAWNQDAARWDINGDGIDDVLLLRKGGESVEVWLGGADGSFAQTDTIVLARPYDRLDLTQFEPPAFELTLRNWNEVELSSYWFDGSDLLVALEAPDLSRASVASWVSRDSGDLVIYLWEVVRQDVDAGLGIMWRDDGEWMRIEQRLEPTKGVVTGELTAADLDADGREDFIVAQFSEEAYALELFCQVDGGFVGCGRMDAPHLPQGLTSIPGQSPRIVYTTEDQGTYMVTVQPVRTCP